MQEPGRTDFICYFFNGDIHDILSVFGLQLRKSMCLSLVNCFRHPEGPIPICPYMVFAE